MGKENGVTLFGGDEGWNASDWIASDDRVRGGSSQSYLEITGSSARFHGNLDIKTLGGAGFASQRTTGEDKSWNLSEYDGIRIDLGKADDRRYTFILKDEILPKSSNGREQSTTSYEYDFTVSEDAALAETSFLFIPWKEFKPTYRGKEKKDASDLDKKHVKRLSVMMRSFFGDQEGDFSLAIKSIKAFSPPADLEKGCVGMISGSSESTRERGDAGKSENTAMTVNAGVGGGCVSIRRRRRVLSVVGGCFVASCLLACYWAKAPHLQWLWN